jgi:hypothetical protein
VARDRFASTYYLLSFERAVEQVAAQADCSVDDAIDLMLLFAETDECSLGDLAVAVLDGRVRFDYSRVATKMATSSSTGASRNISTAR